MSLHGVLVIDKPAGMTSAAVVARVKRALGARRVGHTGTLDPMATGVLPICVGEGTKVAGYLLAEDKSYEGELHLGIETDTLDADGEVTRRRPAEAAAVTEAALGEAAAALTGDLLQVPPMFSAIKQGGRRLHALARAGETVERPPRPVRIDRFALLSVALPLARFAVECSKGTYVRSLVADLGERLGCGAHLTALRRTRSGAFGLDRAAKLADVDLDLARNLLISPAMAVAHLAAVTVGAARLADVACGKTLPFEALETGGPPPAPGATLRLLTPDGALLALVTVEQGRLRYSRVFAQALTKAP